MIKQKLSKRHTDSDLSNTPTDTSLVCSSRDHELNMPKGRASVHDKKTSDNNSKVNHSQHSGSSNKQVSNIVYVLSMSGEPLMPTSQGKASHILKRGGAKVVSRKPFTIQLNYPCGNNKQEIKLGFDPGYEHVGVSATTEKKELYAAEVVLRSDIVGLMKERKNNRKNRRSRLWHRQPRFNHRTRCKGWLSPSIQHKKDSMLKIADRVAKILPITSVIYEVAKFDIQKIQNPEIYGKEYQDGEQKGFENVKKYVLYRDGYKCQHCKTKEKVVLHVHHIILRSNGGTDRPANLITLCEKCHGLVHEEKIKLKIKTEKQFKAETFMNTVRKRMIEELKQKYVVEETYGYLTALHRREFEIDKSHANDAFCIAGGTIQERSNVLYYGQRRRNNRGIQVNRKGFKPSVRKQRYKLQPKDLVRFENKMYLVCGVNSYGKGIYLDDEVKRKQKDKKYTKTAAVEIVKYASGMYLNL